MDADERVTGWNPAATELFGYSPEEAIGRLIDDLVLDEEPAARRPGRHARGARDAGGPTGSRVARRKDGDARRRPDDARAARRSTASTSASTRSTTTSRELQRAREHAETLLAVTQVLGKTLSLEDTIETILDELQRVVPYDSCSVQVIHGNRLVIVGGRGFDDLGCAPRARASTWTTRPTSTARSCGRSGRRSSPTSRRTRISRASCTAAGAFAAGSARR